MCNKKNQMAIMIYKNNNNSKNIFVYHILEDLL